MKALLFTVLMLSTAQVFASGGAGKVCDEMRFGPNKEECHEVIAGKVFDDHGVAFCSEFFHADDIMDCFKVIAHKKYKASDLQACDGVFGDDDKLICLASRGADMRQGQSCVDAQGKLDRIRRLVEGAKVDLSRVDIKRAMNKLAQALRILNAPEQGQRRPRR